jgi:hypothetical protein
MFVESSCDSASIIKRVVIAALFQVRLNLLAEQRPTAPPLLHCMLGYVQNIRSLEYCACTLGKV